ncbi:MAG: hypothetical protein LLF28_08020 [Nitrospiraceae bacterium]|nr:hypothetical protein [Nitrospiraceae bacterium]
MKNKIKNKRMILYLTAVVILLVGLISAALIYLAAENDSGNVLIDEFANSKKYRHALELYGGKLNLITDSLMRWFADLWRGESLAFTIAFIAIFISLIFFYAARHLSLNSDRSENKK